MMDLNETLLEALDTEELKDIYRKYRVRTRNYGIQHEEKLLERMEAEIEKRITDNDISTGNELIDKLLSEVLKGIDTKEVAKELCERYRPTNGHNGKQKFDSKRPLTEEEIEFAGQPKNHNLIYCFLKEWKLDKNDYYDIAALAYLDAVKLYVTDNKEYLQQYAFSTIAFSKMGCAVSNYRRNEHTQKRMPEGGFVSLDYEADDERLNSDGSRIEKWWIDRKVNVERQVISEMLFDEYRKKISELVFAEDSLAVLDMLLYGLTEREILREMKKRQDFDCWNRNMVEYEIDRLRRMFREVFGI